ncbi:MAG: hypothetical protein WCL30_04905, partial [Pseudomonadota bacterium]
FLLMSENTQDSNQQPAFPLKISTLGGNGVIDLSDLKTDTVYRVADDKCMIVKPNSTGKDSYKFEIYSFTGNKVLDFGKYDGSTESYKIDFDKLMNNTADDKSSYDWKKIEEFNIGAKKDQELRSLIGKLKTFTRFEPAEQNIADSLNEHIRVPKAKIIDNDVLSFVADIPDLYLATLEDRSKAPRIVNVIKGSGENRIETKEERYPIKLIAGKKDAEGKPVQPLYAFNAGKWEAQTIDESELKSVAIKNAAGIVEQVPLRDYLRKYAEQAGADGLVSLKNADNSADIADLFDKLQIKQVMPESISPAVMANIADTPKLVLGKIKGNGKLVAGYESGGEANLFVFENKQWKRQSIDRNSVVAVSVTDKKGVESYINSFLGVAGIRGVKTIKDGLPKEFNKVSSFFDVLFDKKFMQDADFEKNSPQMRNYFNFDVSQKVSPQTKESKGMLGFKSSISLDENEKSMVYLGAIVGASSGLGLMAKQSQPKIDEKGHLREATFAEKLVDKALPAALVIASVLAGAWAFRSGRK